MATRVLRALRVLLVAVAAACGIGSERAHLFVPALAAGDEGKHGAVIIGHIQAAAIVPVQAVDAIALMDWAETQYPELFPGHPPNAVAPPYIYRHYPQTGNNLGVAGQDIYLLGPASGGKMFYVGTLSQYSCQIFPLNCTPAVEVQPAGARITVGATRQFSATVTGTENTTVVWTVSGPGCSGAACGTISGGLYKAPAITPTPPRVNVKAALTSSPTIAGTAMVEIVTTENAKLTGDHAFLYQGYWNSALGHCAGKVTLDGAGIVTGGVADCTSPNYAGGVLLDLPLSGTYSVFADNRGEMAWFNGAVNFRFALTADAAKAFLQTFYSPAVIVSGQLLKQDATAFSVAALDGYYVFRLIGGANPTGAASIGRLRANGAGFITEGTIDINDGTSVRQNLAFSGSYAVDNNGRGRAQFAIPGLGSLKFALNVIDRDRFILASIDPPGYGVLTQGGVAERQSGAPFSNASLRATGVFHLSGSTYDAFGYTPEIAIGLLKSDGVGGLTGVLDANRAAAITTNAPFAANYTIAVDGRGTIGSPIQPAYIFYLVRPGHAVLMNAQPSDSRVLSGVLEPQRPGPFSRGSLLGQYAVGTPALTPFTVTVTSAYLVDPTGLISAPQDVTSPLGLGSGVPTTTFTMAPDGRAIILSPTEGAVAVVYVISPTKLVEILTGVPITPPEDKTILYFGEQ